MRRGQVGVLATLSLAAGLVTPAAAAEGGAEEAARKHVASEADYKPTVESLESHPTPEWFKDGKFGIFIHWGAYAVPAWGPEGSYAEWYWRYMNDQGSPTYDYHRQTYGTEFPYDRFIKQWKAKSFDPGAWVDLFEEAGAKYFVLTSKHHEGVALFDSKVTHRDTVDMGPRRDLLGDLFRAARERTDLKAGLYYSLLEWYHPAYSGDGPTNPYTGEPVPYTGAPPVNDYVDDHMLPQMRELINTYDPDILWCDGEWTRPASYWDLKPTLAYYYNQAQNRPDPKHVAAANRCRMKPGPYRGDQLDFLTPEYEVKDDIVDTKWESSRGIGMSYGYNRNEEPADYLTSNQIIDSFVDIVSKNGNLLLNIGPRADGTIPRIMKDRLRDIGAWLDINGEAIYRTSYWTHAEDEASDVEVRYTAKGGALYATALSWPGDTLTLSGDIPLERGSRITLLGSGGERLDWRRDGDTVTVTMPDEGKAATTSEHAYTVKITTPGVRQLVRPEVEAPEQVALGASFTTTVRVTNPSDSRAPAGRVALDVPAGWGVEPRSAVVGPVAAGESRSVTFTVTAPADVEPGEYALTARTSVGRLTYETTSDPIKVGLYNAALGQPATQSSTGYGGDAGRAVDGNTDGVYYNGSVTHTAEDGSAEPWWQVDLGADVPIREIALWNRTDCCAERLSDYYVLVSDKPFTSDSLGEALARPGVAAFHQTDTAGRPTRIPVDDLTGRYVRVQLTGNAPLSLAEVEVTALDSGRSRTTGDNR